MPTGRYRIQLKTRDGDVKHESDFDGELPDIVIRDYVYYVRAGISEKKALYVTAKVLAMNEVIPKPTQTTTCGLCNTDCKAWDQLRRCWFCVCGKARVLAEVQGVMYQEIAS